MKREEIRKEAIRIQNGDSDCPQKLLGRHKAGAGQIIRGFHPEATGMRVLYFDGAIYEMHPMDGTKVYEVYIHRKDRFPYRIETFFADGSSYAAADPYSFKSKFTEKELYLFGQGTHYQIYEKLGAHPMRLEGVDGTYFAVWAPNAARVSVTGDFCCWDGRVYPMKKRGSIGIFELFVPGAKAGAVYKFEIKTAEGRILLKADPYANYAQVRPKNASIVADLSRYKWKDGRYMRLRKKANTYEKPMSIYELHLPSWKRGGKHGEKMLDYRTLAHQLADYVSEMGYTHVELIGVAEHPLDGSWGYQVTGYYAPTSRHGAPEDFMYFVDYLHRKGIGVILDWVPGHFPKDDHGLARFDGTCLFEHPDKNRGEQPQWGTYVFHYGRNEVKNFLISNALFWMKKYHIDGLRADAVSSILYLNYGRAEGEWQPNQYGGNENLEAVEFIKHLNSIVKQYGEGGFVVAEEATAWKGVSQPLEWGGLGFDYKWNMGWMHDFLNYMKTPPYERKYHHRKLTFSLEYAYTEHFVQALSHDEVVHLKGSMIGKMPGNDEEKFANLRLAYGFLYGHPGKKLLFMGQDFGQWAEWNEDKSLDWHLLRYGNHAKLHKYMKKLLHIYKKYKACYELDHEERGFVWINNRNADRSNISFLRRSRDGAKNLLFVCNFLSEACSHFRVGVPAPGQYKLILNSDDAAFGGSGQHKTRKLQTAAAFGWDGQGYSIELELPPLAVLIFEYRDYPL